MSTYSEPVRCVNGLGATGYQIPPSNNIVPGIIDRAYDTGRPGGVPGVRLSSSLVYVSFASSNPPECILV